MQHTPGRKEKNIGLPTGHILYTIHTVFERGWHTNENLFLLFFSFLGRVRIAATSLLVYCIEYLSLTYRVMLVR